MVVTAVEEDTVEEVDLVAEVDLEEALLKIITMAEEVVDLAEALVEALAAASLKIITVVVEDMVEAADTEVVLVEALAAESLKITTAAEVAMEEVVVVAMEEVADLEEQ